MNRNYKTSLAAFVLSTLFILCATQAVFSAELTEKQLWGVALSAIITELNGDSHLTLKMSHSGDHRKDWLATLERDWGITSREELLETLVIMENGGHAAEFDFIKKIIRENNNDLDKIMKNYQLNGVQYNRLLFTLQHWDSCKFASIKSWDLGRNVSLCRWGYEVGFLSETEAWNKIMYYARLIQPLYRSWEEYGYTYAIGRIFWASGAGAGDRTTSTSERTMSVFNKLIKGEAGQWHNLKWNINLK